MSVSSTTMAARAARVERARQALLSDIAALAREIVPHGKKIGASWSGPSPSRDGDNVQAFAVYLNGAKKGGWKDFVTGETGDVFQLVALKYVLPDFNAVLAWAEARYNLARVSETERATLNVERVKREAQADRAAEDARARKVRHACHTFSKAEAEIEYTTVELYWRHRGVLLQHLPNRDRRWIRYALQDDWNDPARKSWPCQLAGFTNAKGVMQALHVTYLAKDGRGKAPIPKSKLMFGPMKGCVIRINHGASELDPEGSAMKGLSGPVIICEGIEDAISFAAMTPEYRVWAAGSLSNYLEIFDHACISSFVIAQDNDWASPQARQLFARAVGRIERFGKPVSVVRSPQGKDFNDLIKEEEHEDVTR